MSLTEDWVEKKLQWHKSYYCQNKEGMIVVATLIGDDTLYSKELDGELNQGYWEVLDVCDYEELNILRALAENGQSVIDTNKRLATKLEELLKSYQTLQRYYANHVSGNIVRGVIKEEPKSKLKEVLEHCRDYIINTPILEQDNDKKQKEIHSLLDEIELAIVESENNG